MGLINSPNIVKSGLVAAYDGANIRSFRGPAQTNILNQISYGYSNQSSSTFRVTNGEETLNIPTVGTRTVKYVDIYNDYNGGSGNCCLSLFSFGDVSSGVTGNTTYTYSILYKTNTGYTHPNYMYRYEYNGGSYITEQGIHSTNNRTHLGDGWYHAWGTFTTQASTNRLLCYLFHYEYATQNRVYVAAVQITQGSYIGIPQHMLTSGQTRGTTNATGGGWVDLSGNGNHGELVNGPTYNNDNGGSIVFDGSNDYINLSSNIQSGYTAATYEFFVRTGTLPSSTYHQLYIQESSTWMALYNFGGVTFFGIDLNNGSGWFDNNGGYNTGARTTTTLANNTNYHVVYTWGNSTVRVYLNGNLESTTSTLQASNGRTNVTVLGAGTTPRMIGSRGSGANPWAGRMYQVKFYSNELTQTQIQQNFNACRDRFGV